MEMPEYLAEMAPAVKTLIAAIWTEHAAVTELAGKLAHLTAATEDGYRRVEQILMVDPLDEDGLATGTHWETYFGVDKDRHHAANELDVLIEQQAARAFSRSAMASALLQYAKQGITLAHGELKNAPGGRTVLDVPLSEFIWMGRNQGNHWDEGEFRKGVTEFFTKLAAVDLTFQDYTARNLGFDIVSALGWSDYEAFERDMISLA